jgi:hypothetical protein
VKGWHHYHRQRALEVRDHSFTTNARRKNIPEAVLSLLDAMLSLLGEETDARGLAALLRGIPLSTNFLEVLGFE